MREDEPTDFWAEFRAPWVQRLLLLLALVASILGRAVEPGLRGLAAHAAFERFSMVSSLASNALTIGLLLAVVASTNELMRRPEIPAVAKWLAFTLGLVGFGLMLGASSTRAPRGIFSLPLALIALVALVDAGIEALRFPHVRALGIVALGLALAIGLRVLAYRLASHEERAVDYYRLARVLGMSALVVEGVSVLTASAWLALRTRWGALFVGGGLLFALIVGHMDRNDFGNVWHAIL